MIKTRCLLRRETGVATQGWHGQRFGSRLLIGTVAALASPLLSAAVLESSQTLSQTDGAAVALADIDGDGDLDAVVTGDTNTGGTHHPTKVWLNDGDGGFEDSGQSLMSANDVVLADFNGDGHVDAALHHSIFGSSSTLPNQSEFRLLLNDGAGNLVDNGQAYGRTDNAYGVVAAADLNDDGDVDLFGGMQGSPDLVFTNGASGLVNSQQSLDTEGGTNGTQDVALGDIDGDGAVDAVIAYEHLFSTESYAQVWKNDGNGAFTQAAQKLMHPDDPEAPPPRGVALEDVDGDGNLDLVATYEERGGTRLWTNDGTGGFSDTAQALNDPQAQDNPSEAIAPVFADMDGDGDSDLVIGTTDGVQLWLNDGQGGFQLAETAQVLGEDIAVGDLNGDGRPDVFVQASSQSEVLLNSGESPTDGSTDEGSGDSSDEDSGDSSDGGSGGGGAINLLGLLALFAMTLTVRRRRRFPSFCFSRRSS